jgi:hypothetical protein
LCARSVAGDVVAIVGGSFGGGVALERRDGIR